jgi:hypothetical protein
MVDAAKSITGGPRDRFGAPRGAGEQVARGFGSVRHREKDRGDRSCD